MEGKCDWLLCFQHLPKAVSPRRNIHSGSSDRIRRCTRRTSQHGHSLAIEDGYNPRWVDIFNGVLKDLLLLGWLDIWTVSMRVACDIVYQLIFCIFCDSSRHQHRPQARRRFRLHSGSGDCWWWVCGIRMTIAGCCSYRIHYGQSNDREEMAEEERGRGTQSEVTRCEDHR